MPRVVKLLAAIGCVLVGACPASARAATSPQPGTGSYGPQDQLHVELAGDADSGYAARILDGTDLVTTRGMVGGPDVTVAGYGDAGADLLSAPDGQLPWEGPVRANVGEIPGDVSATTTPDGDSAVRWRQEGSGANTWIYVVPDGVVQGDAYRASITVRGSGTVYLNVFDGQRDLATAPVRLTDAPQTLTLGPFTVPTGAQRATPRLQIEQPPNSGPVDVTASATTWQPVQRTQVELQNRYRSAGYDARTKTLTLSGARDQVGGATVRRWESYRFLQGGAIDARVGIESSAPVSAWYSPYTSFPAGWHAFSLAGPVGDGAVPGPLPLLGIAGAGRAYGLASGATWDFPLPGTSAPRLTVSGTRVAAPQIGTSATPVQLAANKPRSWQTVVFRTQDDPYALALDGQQAMATALGFDRDDSPGVPSAGGPPPADALHRRAARDLGLIARSTAYWLRLTTDAGAKSVTPASHYAPGTWMRDSFWTTMGLHGSSLEGRTEAEILHHYTEAIPLSGANAGQVPLITGLPGACCPFLDESGLLYLIRMYRDGDVLGLDGTKDLDAARAVLQFVRSRQVDGGRFVTAAPQPFNGQPFSPDSWLDGYGYPDGAVNAYDQGLYVVALMSARRLGLDVSEDEIAAAREQYRALYDPALGYVRWLSTKTYKAPDVLVGEALSLYLFDEPLLSDDAVRHTLAAQAWTPYGMKDLATADGGYVPAGEFLNTTNGGLREEPGGWYQNGGSWFLYEYLAEYAAVRHGDERAPVAMARSVAAELAATPMLKEFKLTAADPGMSSRYDSEYPYPVGTTGLTRQGYGWNAAYVAFARSLQDAPAR